MPFGMSSYRFLVPASILFDDPQTKRFVENGDLEIWKGGYKKLVIYPCRGGQILNCAALLDDNTIDETKSTFGRPQSSCITVANTSGMNSEKRSRLEGRYVGAI